MTIGIPAAVVAINRIPRSSSRSSWPRCEPTFPVSVSSSCGASTMRPNRASARAPQLRARPRGRTQRPARAGGTLAERFGSAQALEMVVSGLVSEIVEDRSVTIPAFGTFQTGSVYITPQKQCKKSGACLQPAKAACSTYPHPLSSSNVSGS